MKKVLSILFSVFFFAFLFFAAGVNPAAGAAVGLGVNLIVNKFIVFPDKSLNLLIGSIPAASSGTINLTYVPEFIYFAIATVPSSFTVDILGDGTIKKLDAAGLGVEKNIRNIGSPADGHLIRLADGFIGGKNAVISITNAHGTLALSVYGFSKTKKMGSIYAQSVQNTVLANSGHDFEDFAFLGLPGIGTDDEVSVTYRNGLVQRYSSVELPVVSGLTQNGPVAAIDNLDQNVRKVSYIPTAQRTVYLMRYAPARGSLNVK